MYLYQWEHTTRRKIPLLGKDRFKSSCVDIAPISQFWQSTCICQSESRKKASSRSCGYICNEMHHSGFHFWFFKQDAQLLLCRRPLSAFLGGRQNRPHCARRCSKQRRSMRYSVWTSICTIANPVSYIFLKAIEPCLLPFIILTILVAVVMGKGA